MKKVINMNGLNKAITTKEQPIRVQSGVQTKNE